MHAQLNIKDIVEFVSQNPLKWIHLVTHGNKKYNPLIQKSKVEVPSYQVIQNSSILFGVEFIIKLLRFLWSLMNSLLSFVIVNCWYNNIIKLYYSADIVVRKFIFAYSFHKFQIFRIVARYI